MKHSKIIIAFFSLASIFFISCNEKKSKSSIVDEMVAKSKEKRKANAGSGSTDNAAATTPVKLQTGNIDLEYQSAYTFTKDAVRSADLKSISPKIKEAIYANLNIPKNEGSAGYSFFKYSEKPSIDGTLEGITNGYLGMGDVKILSKKIDDISSQIGLPAKLGKGTMSKKTASGQMYGEFIHLAIQSGNEIIVFQGVFEQPGNQASNSFEKLLNSMKSTSK